MVGTAALSPEFLGEAACRFGEQLVVAIDVRDGKVAVDGWTRTSGTTPAALAGDCAAAGVARLLVTSTVRDGSLAGPDAGSARGRAAGRAAGDRRRRHLLARGSARGTQSRAARRLSPAAPCSPAASAWQRPCSARRGDQRVTAICYDRPSCSARIRCPRASPRRPGSADPAPAWHEALSRARHARCSTAARRSAAACTEAAASTRFWTTSTMSPASACGLFHSEKFRFARPSWTSR